MPKWGIILYRSPYTESPEAFNTNKNFYNLFIIPTVGTFNVPV